MKSTPAARQSHLKLIKVGEEIRTFPEPDSDDFAFMAVQLVQSTLPHSDPGDVEVFTRRNGNRVLVVQRGWDVERKQHYGYPFGTIPRLLLFWITTEALRTRSPRLELGANLHAFMRQLGLNPDNGSPGAKRSDARRLHDQMARLFRAKISFEVIGPGKQWLNMDVAPKGEFWWDTREPRQQGLYPSWIKLGADFFEAITSSAVPVNMEVLKALKRSPLALDLYAWASYRAHHATQTGKVQFITWAQLQGQLGTDYADVGDFRAATKDALMKIKKVYPGMKLGKRLGGIEIMPGASAVPPRRKAQAPVDQ